MARCRASRTLSASQATAFVRKSTVKIVETAAAPTPKTVSGLLLHASDSSPARRPPQS
jgi:hypothetical protein